MVDLSRLNEQDLKALSVGNMAQLSTEALTLLAGGEQATTQAAPSAIFSTDKAQMAETEKGLDLLEKTLAEGEKPMRGPQATAIQKGAQRFSAAAQGATLGFSDEITGAIAGAWDARDAAFNLKDPVKAFKKGYGETTESVREGMRIAREERPLETVGLEIGGAVVSAVPTGGAAAIGAASKAPVIGQAVLGSRALQTATAGVPLGAAYGAGTAEGGIEERLEGALTGAATGAVFGYAGSKLLGGTSLLKNATKKALAPRTDREVVEFAINKNLPVSVGTAYGGNTVPKIEAFIAQSNITGSALRRLGSEVSEKGKAQVDDIASYISPAAPESMQAAGETVRKGLNQAVKSIKKDLGAKFDAVFDKVPEAIKPELPKTQAAYAKFQEELGFNDKLTEQLKGGALESILKRQATEGARMSVRQLKSLRRQIEDEAQQVAKNVGGDSAKYIREINNILDGELGEIASKFVPKGAQQLKNANRYARIAYNKIEKIEKLVKDDADEALLARFFKLGTASNVVSSKGADFKLLNTIQRRMPSEVMDELASFKLQTMGMGQPGQEGMEAVFNPRTFVTEWKKMSPQARNLLFKNRLSDEQNKALINTTKYFDSIAPKTLNPSGTGAASLESMLYIATAFTFNPLLVLAPLVAGRGLASQNLAKLVNKMPRAVAKAPLNADVKGKVLKAAEGVGITGQARDELEQILDGGVQMQERLNSLSQKGKAAS